MKRTICTLLSLLSLASTAPTAEAGWGLFSPWHSFKREYCENKNWPRQYVYADRATTQAPFDMMVANGWRRQNLMGEHHFDPNTGVITQSGKLQIRWILTQAPPQHRSIFVQRGENPAETAARVQLVKQLAQTFVAPGEVVNVQETHLMAEGRPAEAVDSTHIRFHESQPAPVLPAAQSDEEL